MIVITVTVVDNLVNPNAQVIVIVVLSEGEDLNICV